MRSKSVCTENKHPHFRRDGTLIQCRGRALDEPGPHVFAGRAHYLVGSRFPYYECEICHSASMVLYPCVFSSEARHG